MLDPILLKDHFGRIRASINNDYSLKDIPRFITEHTYIRGMPYSYDGHEFQEYIISSEDPEVNVMKCSQIGLSEIMARWTVSVCFNYPSFSAIVTFPFSGDAADFARTRVDPFIDSSPKLKEAMGSLNNSEIKQILQSFIYFRGTNGKTAAISIPADMIVSDEIDRSDPHVLTQYTSRLTHSPYAWRRNFSTPTVKGYGIDKLMQTSRRFRNLCRCHHCNHHFVPDYFEHVKIPGYDNELRALNKNSISKTRWLEAKLLCPKCGKEPMLIPQYREYVQENSTEQHEAKGIYVSPFDAPKITNPVKLLKAQVSYARLSEFINQNLGQTSEEVSESLTLFDITECTKITDLGSTQLHAMGCDMGLICHIVIGRLTIEGQFLVVHREKVPLGAFEERRNALARQFHVAITVCDSQPYVDLILRLQRVDKNLYGGIFVTTKSLEVFKIKMVDKDDAKGKLPIHQAQIQRDAALDEILGLFKNREIVIQQQNEELDEEFQKHLLDMKRVQVFDDHQELTYTWVKSETAVDHFHFALLYCYTAARLRGIVARDVVPEGVQLFGTFHVKQRDPGPAKTISRRVEIPRLA
jgi:hypothetical protein